MGGGASFDILDWLLNQGIDLGFGGVLTWFGGRAFRGFRNNARDRRARQAALDFSARGIDAPEVLRLYLDSKSSWTVSELTRRLDIGPGTAKRLLRGLGYSRNAADAYELGHSFWERRRRSRWMQAEERTGRR